MHLSFAGKLGAILGEDLGTASQTARGIARSATRFEVASNIAGVVDTKIEVSIVRVRIDGCLLGRRRQERKEAGQAQTSQKYRD